MTDKNIQSFKSTRPARPFVALPGRVRGGRIIEALKKLPPELVGPNPACLAIALDEAFKPVQVNAGAGMDDFADEAALKASRGLADQLGMVIRKAIIQAATARPLLTEADTSAHRDLDAVQMAAAAITASNDVSAITAVADAFRTLAAASVMTAKRTAGRVPVLDAVFVLIRVMVAYLHEHDMPVTSKWNIPKDRGGITGPRSDSEYLPVSLDADLVVRLRALWDIEARNSTLAGALDLYLDQLRKENRKASYSDAVLVEIIES